MNILSSIAPVALVCLMIAGLGYLTVKTFREAYEARRRYVENLLVRLTAAHFSLAYNKEMRVWFVSDADRGVLSASSKWQAAIEQALDNPVPGMGVKMGSAAPPGGVPLDPQTPLDQMPPRLHGSPDPGIARSDAGYGNYVVGSLSGGGLRGGNPAPARPPELMRPILPRMPECAAWIPPAREDATGYAVCPQCSALYRVPQGRCVTCKVTLRLATKREVDDFLKLS